MRAGIALCAILGVFWAICVVRRAYNALFALHPLTFTLFYSDPYTPPDLTTFWVFYLIELLCIFIFEML